MPKRPSPAPPARAFDLFPKSYQLVRDNFRAFAWLNLYPFILTAIQAADTYRRENDRRTWWEVYNISLTPEILIGGGLVALVALGIGAVVSIMLYEAQLRVASGRDFEFSDLWQVARQFWPRMVGLYVLIVLVVVGGLILLIVPGLIFLRRYLLSPYVMLDQDSGIRQAMRESSRLSKPYSGSVWALLGVSLLLSLAGVIPLIGWAIAFGLAMFYSVAPALRYFELKKLVKQSKKV